MKIVVINNHDSFTHNLDHLIREQGLATRIVQNDEMSVQEVLEMLPQYIVISPGPCSPAQAGISVPLIKAAAEIGIPLLGVCLGHQGIGEAFGGKVVHAKELMHGKASPIRHDGHGIFAGIPDGFRAIRYHSLAVEGASLPLCLAVTAWTEDGEIMGLRHHSLPIHGVQFHPESFATDEAAGAALIRNFFHLAL